MTRFEQWMFALAHGIIYAAFLGCITVFALIAHDATHHSPLACAPDVSSKAGK